MTSPVVRVTFSTPALELRQVWAMRDALYAGRTLPAERVDAVRWWRQLEASEIGAAHLAREASTWVPPPGMRR